MLNALPDSVLPYDETSAARWPALPRRTLHDELVTRLRGMIVEGELTPGDRIPELALCDRFGVSRTPFREALKVLSAEGLVRLEANRGASVAPITRRAVDGYLPVIASLEALAGELACARIDAAGLARLRALQQAMAESFRAGEEGRYIELNRAVHRAILEASGNETLMEMHRLLTMRLFSLRFLARKAPPRWREAVMEHERMLEALEARDAAGFAAVARAHIRHKAEVVYEALERLEARAAARSAGHARPRLADTAEADTARADHAGRPACQ
jgi:DNA-binding GntR family transcriptional regulator